MLLYAPLELVKYCSVPMYHAYLHAPLQAAMSTMQQAVCMYVRTIYEACSFSSVLFVVYSRFYTKSAPNTE